MHLLATSAAATACSLLAGSGACRCPDDAPHLSDGQLLARATDMARWMQRRDAEGRAAARDGLDQILAHVRTRGRPALMMELLALAIMMRIHRMELTDKHEVDALLAEFTELAERAGDLLSLGVAAALRAHRGSVFGEGHSALVHAAASLALLTEVEEPGAGAGGAESARQLGRALNLLVVVLVRLGAHEAADTVSRRAIAVAQSGGSVPDLLVQQLNRVRLQLSWALRLERGGREAAAAARFVGAAQSARVAATLWGSDHGRTDGRPAERECPVIGSAYALLRPGPEHLATLEALTSEARHPDDRIVLAIATARCHMADARHADAVAVLAPVRDEIGTHGPLAVLTLALHRELALADTAATAPATHPDDPVRRYTLALEHELWMLREARLAALSSHYEHHRLTREHGAVTAQALQDPLTGLPNRRALDRHLAEATAAATSQPCAVALLDLDHFKDVNDDRSHAAGDLVLREVADCLRRTLRPGDLVARYGGDEFVVIMPVTRVAEAHAALVRATEAIASLPTERGADVTVSVGVAAAPLGTTPEAAIAAADAAMYRAKRAGGNIVVVGAGPAPDPAPQPEAVEERLIPRQLGWPRPQTNGVHRHPWGAAAD